MSVINVNIEMPFLHFHSAAYTLFSKLQEAEERKKWNTNNSIDK